MSRIARMFRRHNAGMAVVVLCTVLAPAVAGAQLVDPTRPPDYLPAGSQQENGSQEVATFSGSPWDLTSTLVSPQRTIAVINGQMVTRGDTVGGMMVKKIDAGEVVLVGGGRTEVIDLVGQDIKKPAKSGGK